MGLFDFSELLSSRVFISTLKVDNWQKQTNLRHPANSPLHPRQNLEIRKNWLISTTPIPWFRTNKSWIVIFYWLQRAIVPIFEYVRLAFLPLVKHQKMARGVEVGVRAVVVREVFFGCFFPIFKNSCFLNWCYMTFENWFYYCRLFFFIWCILFGCVFMGFQKLFLFLLGVFCCVF